MMKGKKEILNNMTCETDQHRWRGEEAAHLSVVSGVLRCSELVQAEESAAGVCRPAAPLQAGRPQRHSPVCSEEETSSITVNTGSNNCMKTSDHYMCSQKTQTHVNNRLTHTNLLCAQSVFLNSLKPRSFLHHADIEVVNQQLNAADLSPIHSV